MSSVRLLVVLFLVSLLTTSLPQSTLATQARRYNQTAGVINVGEGFDFATHVLSDPWDMQQFTDISMWINHSPPWDMTNIQVEDGVFSALTLAEYSEFFPLFPGYEPGMNTGEIGALFPISSSQYSCFYMAMQASWPSSDENYFILFWSPDRQIWQWVDPSYIWGQAYGNIISRDRWELYKVDLANPDHLNQEPWTYLSEWQTLRVTPSLKPNTQFYIDWIRLTDCQPVWVELSSLVQGNYELWIGTGSPERQIIAINSFSPDTDGTYSWDVQGIEAGIYTYYIKVVNGGVVQQGQVTINKTPIVSFTRPSQYSGSDYATSNGNAWDMDPSDTLQIDCSTYAFNNGGLFLDTLPPEQLPWYCVGPGANEADPRIFLNTPDHGNQSAYRYLSFRASIDGEHSVPELGMIFRLFWQLDRAGLEDCTYVSRAIPYEIGWNTNYADMYDTRNGTPEEYTPADCPLVTWMDQASVGPLVSFRMDPNENITGDTMHQAFDWIRLTRVEQVPQGRPAELRALLNMPASELAFLDFYYTTNLNQPTQHPAARYTPPSLVGPYFQFLPLTSSLGPFYYPFIEAIPADVIFQWDTTGVNLGIYHVCAMAGDGFTSGVYCSQAPIEIISP
jgi:hypothetical protein